MNDAVIVSEMCKSYGIKFPHSEYMFCPGRKWRFDFCWPDERLACEVEGAIWQNGRHTRGSGFVKDMEKYNMAAQLGWRLLRYGRKKGMPDINYQQIKDTLNDHR